MTAPEELHQIMRDHLPAHARLNDALRIRKALHELMTVEEADSHGGIFEHLDDFIRDITIDIEADISPLE